MATIYTEEQISLYITPAERNLSAAGIEALIAAEGQKIAELEYQRGMANRTAPYDAAIAKSFMRIEILRYANDLNFAAARDAYYSNLLINGEQTGSALVRIGEAAVAAVPYAIAAAAIVTLAPIAMASMTTTAGATAADIAASADVIASMTGAGVGVTDAAIAASAASSAGVASASAAIAEMGAAQWGVLATGTLAPSGAALFSVTDLIPQENLLDSFGGTTAPSIPPVAETSSAMDVISQMTVPTGTASALTKAAVVAAGSMLAPTKPAQKTAPLLSGTPPAIAGNTPLILGALAALGAAVYFA